MWTAIDYHSREGPRLLSRAWCGFSNIIMHIWRRVALRSEWTLSSSVIAGPLPPSLPPRKLVVGVVTEGKGVPRDDKDL